MHDQPQDGAGIDDALDHPQDAVLADDAQRLQVDPLRPDRDPRRPAGVLFALTGDELELAEANPAPPFPTPCADTSMRFDTPRKSATYAVASSS
jgi:hypothetical protein